MTERSASMEDSSMPLLKEKRATLVSKEKTSTLVEKLRSSPCYRTDSILAIVAFCTLGPTLIFLNNYILTEMDFPYPTFLSMMGLASTSIYAHISRASVERTTKKTTPQYIDAYYYKCILIVGVCQGLTLWTGLKANLYLGVGLIQMMKSATIVCVLMLSVATGIVEYVSRDVKYSLLVIIGGLVLSAKGDPNFSLLGMIVMGSSIVTESMRCVTVEIMTSRLQVNKLKLLSHIGPVGFIIVTIVFLIYESGDSFMEHGILIIRDKPWLFMLSGFLGFGVNFSSIWVTQTNSAVTLQIVVSIRNILVVAISVLAGEHISLVKFLGFSIVLIGAYMYREAKRWEEMETKRKKEGVAMNDESLV